MNKTEFQRSENLSFEIDETLQRRKPKNNKGWAVVIILRSLISVVLSLVLAFSLLWTYAYTILRGPSEDMKERFVLAACEKPYTEWIPHLVLPSDEIEAIMERQGD